MSRTKTDVLLEIAGLREQRSMIEQTIAYFAARLIEDRAAGIETSTLFVLLEEDVPKLRAVQEKIQALRAELVELTAEVAA